MDTTLFRCAECGYRANVLAANCRDHEAVHGSMVCPACRMVIVSVVARLTPGGSEPGQPADRWRPVAVTCPHCSSGVLLPWPPTHPCPRCGSEMDEN